MNNFGLSDRISSSNESNSLLTDTARVLNFMCTSRRYVDCCKYQQSIIPWMNIQMRSNDAPWEWNGGQSVIYETSFCILYCHEPATLHHPLP